MKRKASFGRGKLKRVKRMIVTRVRRPINSAVYKKRRFSRRSYYRKR